MAIFASLMCADQMHLAQEVKDLEDAGIDGFHLDIMDGMFVPNIGLGFPLLGGLRRTTTLPIHAHLMIKTPERFIQRFTEGGADIISFHYESTPNAGDILKRLREFKIKKAMAVNPKTEIEAVYPYLPGLDIVLVMAVEPGFAGGKYISATPRRIEKIAGERRRENLRFKIEVDGNINKETVPELYSAGAEIFVGGSTGLFIKGKSFSESILHLRESVSKL